MVNTIGSSEYFSELKSYISTHGIDTETYKKIAIGFTKTSFDCSKALLLDILGFYIKYEESPLYVNEIQNFLKENDKRLYEAYGKLFVGVPGCKEVFGIDVPGCPEMWPEVVAPVAPQSGKESRNASKRFDKPRKRREKNLIKKQAIAEATARHRQNIEKKADKRRRRAEFEKLAKYENGG
ncbi:hypothetical protein PAEPH01_2369 [Pancytospora epiphaga]|nr:hypothetical protein PAEPH01_2369 [Pancytospora epiphaga]